MFSSKTSSVHSRMSLIPTFNHFVNIVHLRQMKVTHNKNIFYETWTILITKGSQ